MNFQWSKDGINKSYFVSLLSFSHFDRLFLFLIRPLCWWKTLTKREFGTEPYEITMT